MGLLSAVLVGDAAITVRCGQLLLAAGHSVLGAATGDARVAGWAAESGIACCFLAPEDALGRDDVATLVAEAPFDLLLSVHNLRILEPDLLALPRTMAINYHDAPLPRYAGLHATSWAIRNGETRHGIVWHRMSATIDGGDILVERSLDLGPDDTAWTVNLRCTEAALEGFAELVARIAGGALGPRNQELAARTYFPGWRRPTPGCVLPVGESAESLSAFVRALDFGASDNPLGIAKIVAPGGVFGIRRATVLAARSRAPAGTVVQAQAGTLDVATTTFDLRLAEVRALGGGTGQFPRPGDRLAGSAPEADLLAARERDRHRHQAAWMRTLSALAPLAPPGFEAEVEPAGAVERVHVIELPPGATASGDDDLLLESVLAWLGTAIGQPFDIALGEPELRTEIAARGWEGFFAARPSLRVPWRTGLAPRELRGAIAAERARCRARGTYAVDLPFRVRRLAAGFVAPRVAIDLLAPGETAPAFPAASDVRLAIALDGARREITLRARLSPEDDAIARLSASLSAWLEAAAESESAGEELAPVKSRPAIETVGDRFRAQVQRAPQALAIAWGAESLTYGQLAQRVDRLSHALVRRGVSPEVLVALRLARLPDLVTAMLAVHAAGGAFLVLDSGDTSARAARILAEAAPLLALADSGLHGLAPHLPVHPIALAEGHEISPGHAGKKAAPAGARGRDLAYVATTSGSTAAPKGVAVEQGALDHYIAVAGRHFGLEGSDRILQVGSPAFDLAFEQIFGALCHGAALVGLDRPALPAPRELVAVCAEFGITVLDLPTAVWEQVAAQMTTQALALPPCLRLLVLGGELATAGAARAWLDASGGARLVNTYGPTEATIVATWWEAPRRSCDLENLTALPIGRSVEGVVALVLDKDCRPVADGAAGELWLGGAGLARGYHRRPELTAARFHPRRRMPQASPGAAAGGPLERLFATGDQVRRSASGELEFLGRLDRQLKIGGRRVEPQEVEATLRAIPGVVAAAVDGTTARSGVPAHYRRLRGWIVLAPGAVLSVISAEAARRLPSYLLPTPLVAVAALPLDGRGKIDLDRLRRASPPSAATASTSRPDIAAAVATVAPGEEVERRLRTLWAHVLGADVAEPIARDADFFEAGGDSLAAISLLVEIEAAFGVALPIAALLRSPTLAGLAAALRAPLAVGVAEQPAPARGSGELSSLVRLGPATDAQAPAIFCVHGLGGHLLRLVPLARALAPERALVGLQSPGLDDDRAIPSTIEQLARHFLAEIRGQGSPPPYRLAGMSFGGLVAFEMARRAAPGEIAWVALLDSELATVLADYQSSASGDGARLRGLLRRLAGDAFGRLRRTARRLRIGRDEVVRANEYRHFSRVLRANEAALARYRPGSFAGKAIFFAATPRPAEIYAEFLRLTGGELEIVPVPGDHLSMLESPQVEVLAAEILRRG